MKAPETNIKYNVHLSNCPSGYVSMSAEELIRVNKAISDAKAKELAESEASAEVEFDRQEESSSQDTQQKQKMKSLVELATTSLNKEVPLSPKLLEVNYYRNDGLDIICGKYKFMTQEESTTTHDFLMMNDTFFNEPGLIDRKSHMSSSKNWRNYCKTLPNGKDDPNDIAIQGKIFSGS